jgi:hypothetical protein
MEVTHSSETSVYNKKAWHHIPDDDILRFAFEFMIEVVKVANSSLASMMMWKQQM